jgi:predicted dehydrogenase
VDRQRLRAAVIGVGRRGRSHVGSIVAMRDRYDLAAVCDTSQAAANAAAREFNVPGYSDLARMFAEQSLDVVVVATPPETHHVAAQAAAERGVHMLIEAPLATTRRMMEAIRDAAANASVHVEVAENKFRWPDARLNKRALEAGVIGTVLRVASFYEDAGHESCYHTISKLQYYAGADVVEVEAQVASAALAPRALLPEALKPHSTPGASVRDERWTQATLRFSNGVIGSCVFVSSWLTPGRRGHPHFTTIEGDAGFIAVTGADQSGLHWTHDGQRRDAEMKIAYADGADRNVPLRFYYECEPVIEYRNPFPSYTVDARVWGMGDAIARFAQLDSIHGAVTTGGAPDYGLERAMRDQVASIAIAESAEQRRPLRLDEMNGETAWERRQHELARRLLGRDPFADV